MEQQEQKYTAELDNALKEYAELQTQTTDFDFGELTAARLDIRPDEECDAQYRIKSAYGNQYNPLMMLDSERDVAKLLHEGTERKSIRAQLRQYERGMYNSHSAKSIGKIWKGKCWQDLSNINILA